MRTGRPPKAALYVLLKLPPTEKMLKAGFKKNKSANLREAYEFFTGQQLVDAHSAMADAQACLTVYRAIKAGQRERVPLATAA